MTGRSAAVRLGEIDLPLTAMQHAGRRAGSTINDVFLSGILGGLGLYHQKHGAVPPSIRVGMPISTRTEETGIDLTNQVEGAVLRGPLQLADPVERTRLVHELVLNARGESLLTLVGDLTGLAARIPGVVEAVARAVSSIDVLASNLPGPPVDLFLAGARLERMVPVGPRGGAGLNLTLLSYRDTVHVGVNMDPLATPDSDVLLDCLRAGFEEVLG
jgi:hypothetical protein